MTSTSFVSHLEGAIDGTRLPAGQLATTHADRPILVRYDLDRIRASVDRDALSQRPATMWRYRELLPVEGAPVSLEETTSPLVSCPRLGALLGAPNLLIKDESRLPTGSFKARGMAMAVSMARHFGVRRVVTPTAGNAGGALAAYAARAGIECYVLMPDDTPVVNQREAALHGAHAFVVDGLIDDCGRLAREGAASMGWFDMSTLREPYRIEGKKTMGFELAEQLGWTLPDVIMYPTGGGTGLIGMDKAFTELASLGWLEDERRPRFFACQSSGCAPIVYAFDAGERFASRAVDPVTIASGLRVPGALGDFLILDAVRRSGGRVVAAAESEIALTMRMACAAEGVAVCPETAACLVALRDAVAAGHIDPEERVVVFNTGAVQKYVEAMAVSLRRLSASDPIDWSELADG